MYFQLLLFAASLMIAAIIPQQPASFANANDFIIWVSGLPAYYRPFFQTLDFLGLFKIYQTFWLWLPLSFLIFVSLIILGDYGPPIWQRFGLKSVPQTKLKPYIQSQHFAQTLRLTAPKDSALATKTETLLPELTIQLEKNGYKVYISADKQSLFVSRFAWRWAKPLWLVGGLLLIILALTIQFLFGGSQTAILATANPEMVNLGGQAIILENFSAFSNQAGQVTGGLINLKTANDERLTWQLHRPKYYAGWWIVPTRVQHIGQLTLAQNDNPAQNLELIFLSATEKKQVNSAETDLIFEISYLPNAENPSAGLALIPQTGAEMPQIERQGETFSLPAFNLQGSLSLHDRIFVQAHRLPGLGLLLGGSLMLLVGLLLFILPPPQIFTIQLLTKGRGSRLEIQGETLNSYYPVQQTLNLLQSIVEPEN